MVAMAQGSDDMSEESKEMLGLWELDVHEPWRERRFPYTSLFPSPINSYGVSVLRAMLVEPRLCLCCS